MSTTTTRDEIPAVALARRYDAEALNAVVNDPSVKPWVQGTADGDLDLTVLATDPRNVLLVGDHGSMLFTPNCPGIWEVHTQVLRSGRGAWTLGLVKAALGWLFTHTDAMEVLTRIPRGNLGALALSRKIGGTESWVQPDGWVLAGKSVACAVHSLTLQTWLRGELAASVESLARDMFRATGEPTRAEALRPLGFALAAIRGAQPDKGCVVLNRWAAVAGLPASFVADRTPLVINFGGALIRFDSDGVAVDYQTAH